MKTYFYRQANGEVIRIECEQMFWSGTACVFVKGGLAAAVIALLPGEIVAEEGIAKEVQPTSEAATALEKGFTKPN